MEVMSVRTTLDLDEQLILEAMAVLKVNTKREAVNRALEALVRDERRNRLRSRLGHVALGLTMEELHQMRQDER